MTPAKKTNRIDEVKVLSICPPHSLRTLPRDHHWIIVSAEDIPFSNATHRDSRVPAKAKILIDIVRRLFPRIEMEPAYTWTGTFGETKDGLSYMDGNSRGDARVHFALGYGGNGITFSAIAAEVLTAAVLRKPHRYRDTFSFDR